jgi:hypothetical protein
VGHVLLCISLQRIAHLSRDGPPALLHVMHCSQKASQATHSRSQELEVRYCCRTADIVLVLGQGQHQPGGGHGPTIIGTQSKQSITLVALATPSRGVYQ